MSTSQKQERRRYAGEQARDLVKLARKLALPSSEHLMLQNAVNAQVVVNRIVWALQPDQEAASGTIREALQADVEAPMKAIGEVIQDAIGTEAQYALLVFAGDFTNYISNAVRDDIVAAMREFIAHHEARIQPAPEGEQ